MPPPVVDANVPTSDAVRAGDFDDSTLPASAPIIALWADIFGVVSDDVLTMRIIGPDGSILVEKRWLLPVSQPQFFEFIGRRRHDANWPAGKYLGEITLVRPHAVQGGSFEKRVLRELNVR